MLRKINHEILNTLNNKKVSIFEELNEDQIIDKLGFFKAKSGSYYIPRKGGFIDKSKILDYFQERECCICFDNKKLRMLDCEHEFCDDCLRRINDYRCPLCRRDIQDFIEDNFGVNIDYLITQAFEKNDIDVLYRLIDFKSELRMSHRIRIFNYLKDINEDFIDFIFYHFLQLNET